MANTRSFPEVNIDKGQERRKWGEKKTNAKSVRNTLHWPEKIRVSVLLVSLFDLGHIARPLGLLISEVVEPSLEGVMKLTAVRRVMGTCLPTSGAATLINGACLWATTWLAAVWSDSPLNSRSLLNLGVERSKRRNGSFSLGFKKLVKQWEVVPPFYGSQSKELCKKNPWLAQHLEKQLSFLLLALQFAWILEKVVT